LVETIKHQGLPEAISVYYEPVRLFEALKNRQEAEAHSGSYLIRKVAREHLSARKVEIIAKKYEKPRAFINGSEVSVSFSHTKTGLALAISKSYNVGCDIELSARHVSPLLVKRMKHEQEDLSLYEQLPAVQIWTFKEAALKMMGTGLRNPMHNVKISQGEKDLLDVEINDGIQAKICSFQYHQHWVTICYRK
jgi:phosphopantetheinyl transferase